MAMEEDGACFPRFSLLCASAVRVFDLNELRDLWRERVLTADEILDICASFQAAPNRALLSGRHTIIPIDGDFGALNVEDFTLNGVLHVPGCRAAEHYLQVFPHDVKYSRTTSSKGGFGISIGSRTIHAPKYPSAHHLVLQKVRFARNLFKDTFGCPKPVVPCACQPTDLADSWKATVLACKDAHELADTEPERHRCVSWIDLFSSTDLRDLPDRFGFLMPVFSFKLTGVLPVLLDEKMPMTMFMFAVQAMAIPAISMVSRPGNGGSGSEGAAWQSDVHRRGADSFTGDEHGAATTTENGTAVAWLMATAAPHHATGNRGLLSGFTPERGLLFVLPAGGDGAPMPVRGRGSVTTGAVVLPDVWFVPGLAANLVSASQLAELGYSVGFARGLCSVRSDGGAVVAGEARVGEDGLFALEFLRIPLDAV